jgi:TonB family protein
MTAARVSPEALESQTAPQLLVELPSWPRVFFGNLRDLVFPRRLPHLKLRSAPAPFWPDVFVKRRTPWFAFLQSSAWHVAAFTLLVEITRFFALQPQPAPLPVFNHSQLIYYSAADSLPPLDTRVASTDRPRIDRPRKDSLKNDPPEKADPEFSRQPIISLPRETDNRSQTIVTPPNIKLKRDVALPNIIAWSDGMQKPRLAIPAAPLTPAAELSRIASPTLPTSIVAPPPSIETASNQPLANRKIGDLDIAHSSIIAPAPQLPVAEQRATTVAAAPQVVPPPPSLRSSESSGSRGRIIALNLHPAIGAPPDPPAGNRRGSFAATPDGHPGATGSVGSSASTGAAGHSSDGAGAASRKGSSNAPTGLYVGSAPASSKTSSIAGDPAGNVHNTINPNLLASARMPHAGTPGPKSQTESMAGLSEAERSVFAGRRFYSLTLNMPNLNSAGGSWVVHFAELHPDPNSSGELLPPVALRKVDPGYPLQLMRQNVAGTVILDAIIHADGGVSDVHVLRSVDPRLDREASAAVAQWQFQPATKNGAPVEVEATFQIPFHPSKLNSF